MFDLEKEVAAWSAGVDAGRCRQAASAAELSDHLYCEIERAREDGLSDEQAFAAAVAKLGRVADLTSEHAKGRSVLGRVCAAAERYDNAHGESRELLLAHGILWAAVMLGSSLMLVGWAAPKALAYLLIGVLVPGWWASQAVMLRALRRRRSGGA